MQSIKLALKIEAETVGHPNWEHQEKPKIETETVAYSNPEQ